MLPCTDLSPAHRNKRAVGVEYLPNKRFYPTAGLEVFVAHARRQVVLSAGAFGSPSILERSGIGSAAVLKKAGVSQIVDLPGVGENYQGQSAPCTGGEAPEAHGGAGLRTDHQVIFAPYIASEDAQTLDGIVTDNEAELKSERVGRFSGSCGFGSYLRP